MTIYASKQNRGFYDSGIHETIPGDAVEISQEYHAELMQVQASGKVIDWSGDVPVAVEPQGPSPMELISAQIRLLESQQTDRRIREAVLGIDGGWLANLNAQIEELRAALREL